MRSPIPSPLIRTPDQEDPLSGDVLYPGHGYPQDRRETRSWMSPWGRLRGSSRPGRGQPLGKTVNFGYDAHGTAVQRSQESILQIEGDDDDAQQVTVTLNSPRVCETPFSHLLLQNVGSVKGNQDNIELLERGNFPGTSHPISWPPFYAYLEWGTGGCQAQALVDFVNGATINLVVSFLRVSAMAFLNPTDVAGTSAVYALSAFVGPGFTRPGVAQFTSHVGTIASQAESVTFPVPRFAKSATVVSCDTSAAPSVAVTVATLRFWQSPDGHTGGNSAGNFLVSGNVATPFDVPNGAAYASVVNGMGISTKFMIVYNLAI
jgi:hypothetical protein